MSRTVADPSIDIVVPAYNEERRLIPCIGALVTFLQRNPPSGSWQITIAENGSTDRTQEMARRLARIHPEVKILSVDRPGRGRALKIAWQQSRAEFVAYTDLDLATDLEALPRLLTVLDQGYDLAVGSRLTSGATVVRSIKRELLSRAYNRFIRWLFHPPFADAQCGFKAMRRRAILPLLGQVWSNGWFFDTELLLLAQRHHLRIKEIPICWSERPGSHVRLPSTIFQMSWGLIRVKWQMGSEGRFQNCTLMRIADFGLRIDQRHNPQSKIRNPQSGRF